MADRVRRTLRGVGLTTDVTGPILRSHEHAMRRRRELLDDDHHPAFLHPGRTILVALEDAGVRDPAWLALAPLLDSVTPDFAPDPGEWTEALQAVPPLPLEPGATLEELVQLDAEPLRVVLSEALDQLRHLHLIDDTDHQRTLAMRVEERVLPLAARAGGTLDRRFRWWWRRVGRGFV